MKKISLLVLVVSFSLVTQAAASEGLKIGFVKFEEAFEKQFEAQKYTADIEKEERAILESEQKARAEIEAEMTKLQGDMAMLSEKARQEKQAALGEKINKKQEELNRRRNAHNENRQKILGQLEQKNRDLIKAIAIEKGLDLVAPMSVFVYISPKMAEHDLTNVLVTKYNAANPVKVAPKALPKLPAKKATDKK